MRITNIHHNGKAVTNQYIIFDGGLLAFKSYDSIIARYSDQNHSLIVGRDWDYSRTTLRWFSYFINTYTCFEYESKSKFANLMNDDFRITYNSDLR